MKTAIAFIILSVGAQVHATPTKLLEYNFNHQQERSTLQIFSDGTVMHAEYTCCPSRKDELSENKLSAAQLSQLEADITGASKGTLNARDGGDMKSSPKHGVLYVYKNSRPVIIVEIEPIAGNLSLTTNQAPEAANIIRLVSGYTKVDP